MEKIKKWLLPSRKNNHHPHIIRPVGLGLALLLITFSNVSYNYISAKKPQVLGYATSISVNEIISLSNQQRTANGLGTLKSNAQLTQAAQAKAQDMFAKDYWSHYNPEGQGPAYFISNAGYSFSVAGENLAKDFNTSSGVVNAWMNSSGHRANILNGSFTDTGIAVVNGNLQGSDTTLVVAMYGAPPSPPAPTTPVHAATTTPTRPTTSPQTTQPTQTPQQTPAQAQSAKPAPAVPPAAESKNLSSRQPASRSLQTTGQVNGASLNSKSTTMREELNWAQNVSLVILSTLLLINVLKHTLVWRSDRRGWRHIWFRAHPAAQYALILVAIASTIISSSGAIL